MVESCSPDAGRNGVAGCESSSTITTKKAFNLQLDPIDSVCFRQPGYGGWVHSRHSTSLCPSSHIGLLSMLQGLGTLATATGYVLGQFKLRYPHVHNMADAGELIAGPLGREVLGAAQIIFMVFVCASHVLTGLIAFDTSTWIS